uniref:Protein FAM83G n=1 Tax=Geotrypetes seraphini TaxID=260995 RepID=A0A6P8SXQ8_GEOSA|nr:protein FAM83G [Geotrypetes seraphini]
MALSQVQCLDDSNVNWRYTESKPEFFYSEEQRLALEALITHGTDAFYEVLKKENIRDFLSELERKRILDRVEPYDPGKSPIGGDGAKEGGEEKEEGEGDGEEKGEAEEEGMSDSLEYWPLKSDCSIPELDLGWPDVVVYRGVTRATVYMQPPLDGQPHIKEVVRKMVGQAQKVIAVVMDMFTDVDIFKDMLDVGFKRKVGVYIILEETNVNHFLQMCERAQMHAGHLKNLRVRCTGGTEFYTRSTKKFKGALAQKFMFVDGDRAVCGAYSFTWSAARTDRNVITVLTGQVVEAFDKQFQELYLNSKGVSLKTVTVEDEPKTEPVFQTIIIPAAPAPDVAKKLINPKYALVKTKSASDQGTDNKGGSKEGSKAPDDKNCKDKQQSDVKEEVLSNIHPALQNMEKINMFDYLPTWVEPEPEPSEVLGYINIVNPNIKNAKLSQMSRIKICDTAQAMAQHMMIMQNKQVRQTEKTQDNMKAPPRPTGGTKKPKTKKARESSKLKTSQAQESPRPEAPEVQESPKPKTPESPAGPFSLLAGGQHLKKTENEARDTSKNGDGNQPPVPKPRTVPVADLILKNNAINESQSKIMNEDDNKTPMVNGLHKVPMKPKSPKESKPSNVPCTQNGIVENGKEEEEEEEEEEEDEEEDENEKEEYVSLSDQDRDSFSDCSSSTNHYKSNASSVSEEYYDLHDHYRPSLIQRRHSEWLPNGESNPLMRKMSEGHISRGTFISPLQISQSMQEIRQEDEHSTRKNKALEEGIKRAMEKTQKHKATMNEIKRLYSIETAKKVKPFHFGQRASFKASRDHSGFQGQNQELHAGGNYRGERIEGYHHPTRTSDTSANIPRFGNSQPASAAHQQRNGKVPSFLDTHVVSDGINTPFGIPYSKLSQSKHLINRLAGHGAELKRRGYNDQ